MTAQALAAASNPAGLPLLAMGSDDEDHAASIQPPPAAVRREMTPYEQGSFRWGLLDAA